MIITGQQPNYLPWIGFFHKVAAADALVIMDDVQYEHQGVTNRNEIKGPKGRLRLTVPVLTKGRSNQSIRDVEVDTSVPWGRSWRRKHWETLRSCYGRAPHFRRYSGFFETLYRTEWERLAPLNERIIRFLLDEFGIDRPVMVSSELNPDGQKTARLVSMCRKAGAGGYLSGAGGRKYVDEAEFRQAGLTHGFQSFHHPVYAQLHGEFEPNLSAVDLLFNLGPEAGDVIASAGDPGPPVSEDGPGPAVAGKEKGCSAES